MGRFWYLRTNNAESNIVCDGKFWNGIQSSSDFEHLGFTKSEHQTNCWKVCNCFADFSADETYCDSCYESYEQHLEAIKDEEGDDEFEGNLWEECETSVNYEATNDSGIVYDQIEELIAEYEKDGIAQWFDNFSITHVTTEDNEINIVMDASWENQVKTLSLGQLQIMAKYYLCKIVKYVFDLGADSISVDCEC